jgi:hypothetical protein
MVENWLRLHYMHAGDPWRGYSFNDSRNSRWYCFGHSYRWYRFGRFDHSYSMINNMVNESTRFNVILNVLFNVSCYRGSRSIQSVVYSTASWSTIVQYIQGRFLEFGCSIHNWRQKFVRRRARLTYLLYDSCRCIWRMYTDLFPNHPISFWSGPPHWCLNFFNFWNSWFSGSIFNSPRVSPNSLG